MKKCSVLVFILLSLQLCGCSDRSDKIILDAPETVSLDLASPLTEEEKDIQETDLSVGEVRDDNSETFTETENNAAPISSESAENMEDSLQSTSSWQEDITTTDNGYYSAATDISSAEVERYATEVRQQFLEHDWSAIASEIAYPIKISDVTYNSSADFLDASGSFESSLDDAFFSALEGEDCVDMFCSYEGIMIGESGQIWIGEVLNADLTSQGLKIISINGLVK